MSGKQFGHYKIIREIGAGGMGAVFLAERDDGEFEQQVAIKIIRQAIAESEIINRFKRERQILATLNHPNIAKLLDGGVSEDGLPFLAMEFVEGETITKFAASENLNLEERLKLFLKVCSAVAIRASKFNRSPRHQTFKYFSYKRRRTEIARFWFGKTALTKIYQTTQNKLRRLFARSRPLMLRPNN